MPPKRRIQILKDNSSLDSWKSLVVIADMLPVATALKQTGGVGYQCQIKKGFPRLPELS